MLAHHGYTIGDRILEKSRWEYLTNADYSMGIVLAAMAVECELARLFFKWRGIELLAERGHRTSTEDLEPQYRKLGTNVAKRIDRVAAMLDPRGLDVFARWSPLAGTIERDHPSLHLGSLAKDIQQALFWPRNRILHDGFTEHAKNDAERCHRIAALVLELLKRLDVARRRVG